MTTGDDHLPAGVKTSDGNILKITQVKQACYNKGKSTFTINYTYDATPGMDIVLPKYSGCRKQNYDVMSEIFYPRKLPFTIPKKNDLDKLCKENIIPERYHQEFLDLRSTPKKRDTLPETDAEDLTDDEDN
nr:unnamed protein product [Callosobruchus chinensis]